MGRLDLLGHDARLRLRTRSRRVIAREREEHHEPEQHGKSGSKDPEDASGAVAVVEVAAIGCLRRTQSTAAIAMPVVATTMRIAIARLIKPPSRQ